MSGDSYQQLGIEYYRVGDKIMARVLLTGLLLLLSHMLRIAPSEIDAAGAKIAIKDPIIVQGALSLLYIHYFWMMVMNSALTNSFMPLRWDRLMTRSFLRSASNPYKDAKTKRMTRRTPKQAKRRVWRRMLALNLFVLPYFLGLFLLLLVALALALPDAWSFGEYVWHQQWNLGLLGNIAQQLETALS